MDNAWKVTFDKIKELSRMCVCVFVSCTCACTCACAWHVRVYGYNIIHRSGRSDYETQSTKNLIYLYNVYKTRNIIRVGQHAEIGESPAITERRDIIWSQIKALCTRFAHHSPRCVRRNALLQLVVMRRGSGTLCSANNNRNRIVPRSSITAVMRKRTCAYWLIAFESQRRFRRAACTILCF